MGIVAWLMRHATDQMVDGMMERLLKEPYTENVGSLLPIMRKVGVMRFLETGIRAQTGKPASRPLGSPVVLSDWDRLLFSPVHLSRMPTPDGVEIETSVTIGPAARRPLQVDIPLLIAAMSYGGALHLRTKVALARAATLAGTATNTGEAPLVPEERHEARRLIGQCNRGGWLNDPESLRQLDAIEIQLGQGAQGSSPMRTAEWITGPRYRELYRLREGEDAVIHSRLPGVDSPADFVRLVQELRAEYGVPVGLKISATHHLERELAIALEAGVDFVTVDGAEGGTHGGPVILQDDFGLPTLFGVARAARYLEQAGARDRVTLIAAGGLVTPGHFLKALALGARAVYLGTIALIALLHTQISKAIPLETAPQAVLYTGRYTEDLDIDQAATSLYNFLQACVQEMGVATYSLGKTALSQVDRSDLVCVDRELAGALGVAWAGEPSDGVPANAPTQASPTRAVDGSTDGATRTKPVVARGAGRRS